MSKQRAVVLGTGAWGTTFAQVLAHAGMNVTMWGRSEDTVSFINDGENSRYLPGIELDPAISATTELDEALRPDGENPALVALAVPTSAIVSVTQEAELTEADTLVLSLAKGLEPHTYRTVQQMIAEEGQIAPERIAVLSGPNLSREIADQQPAAAVVASDSVETAKQIAIWCHNPYFRPYVSTDVIGVELAGASKNVIALAIGASEGMGLGSNTRATLITRGLAEMTRLGVALGANPQTYAGLAGVGDLIATCSSKLSRNYSLGFRLGQGMSLREALDLSPGVVEGVATSAPVLELAQSCGVDMPITAGVVAVLSGKATVQQMGESLLARPQKMDGWEVELLD
ncbi:NAD(P)H-dependent glycerol-3-phosphate dehydrogenase [Scrofimicrobium sp. R131]|uniref:Glycerol-3-phosphate dehydrogenase [NAD(P)+] n=1 Tax=Scrofimicrobium appendicitidis TaxID=3079930 RepID=A0AAU7V8R9_9ACTO